MNEQEKGLLHKAQEEYDEAFGEITITEAIKTNTEFLESLKFPKDIALYNSIKLGNVALKRCKYISEHTSKWADIPLSGETK